MIDLEYFYNSEMSSGAIVLEQYIYSYINNLQPFLQDKEELKRVLGWCPNTYRKYRDELLQCESKFHLVRHKIGPRQLVEITIRGRSRLKHRKVKLKDKVRYLGEYRNIERGLSGAFD
jgi:hypothetical protein